LTYLQAEKDERTGKEKFIFLRFHQYMAVRKLLAHAHELKRLHRRVEEKGYTLIPLDFHFTKGRVKVELGLCKGKKQADKRDAMKERDVKREMARAFRDRQG